MASGSFSQFNLASRYFPRGLCPKYVRRSSVSRPCSERERVVPLRKKRQKSFAPSVFVWLRVSSYGFVQLRTASCLSVLEESQARYASYTRQAGQAGVSVILLCVICGSRVACWLAVRLAFARLSQASPSTLSTVSTMWTRSTRSSESTGFALPHFGNGRVNFMFFTFVVLSHRYRLSLTTTKSEQVASPGFSAVLSIVCHVFVAFGLLTYLLVCLVCECGDSWRLSPRSISAR